MLSIDVDAYAEPVIHYLEHAPMTEVTGAIVVGRVRVTSDGPVVVPITLHRPNGSIVHLHFGAGAPARTARHDGDAGQSEAEREGDDAVAEDMLELEEESSAEAFDSGFPRAQLRELDDALLELAERGVASRHPHRLDRLRTQTLGLERMGLRALGSSVRTLVERPDAQALLRCQYVSILHRSAAVRCATMQGRADADARRA